MSAFRSLGFGERACVGECKCVLMKKCVLHICVLRFIVFVCVGYAVEGSFGL